MNAPLLIFYRIAGDKVELLPDPLGHGGKIKRISLAQFEKLKKLMPEYTAYVEAIDTDRP